ncbi:MAG TPA: TetR/AcrR family transcriptional regulator [Thermotogota bacterium]|nr:TetR/AcrR family transcriptional regulator [Thermotogota bacterium]
MKNKEIKRNLIIDSAEELFFTKGYRATSMDQIAQKAEVAKGTLYLYFNNKKELYYAVGNRAMDCLKEMFIEESKAAADGLERLTSYAKAFLNFRVKYPDYYDFIIDYQSERYKLHKQGKEITATYADSAQLFKMIINSIKEGQADGSIKINMEPERLASVLWCEICGVAQLADFREQFFFQFSKNITAENIREEFVTLTGLYMRNGIANSQETIPNKTSG